jgi:hypothetical protein
VSRWTVGAGEAGARLDKFLAAPDRLGSRSRAVTARERGKVFVNDAGDAAELREGEFHRCQITEAHDYDLVARLV